MKKIIFLILWLIANSNLFASAISIYYPTELKEICNSNPLILKWTGTENVNVEIKKESDNEYKPLLNYQINDNTLNWTLNDADYLNFPLSIKISEKTNPGNYDEIAGIIIFSSVEIINQTQSFSICKDEMIYLQIDALGFGLKYQWYKDNELITGATSNVFSINNSDYSHSGVYHCKISTSGVCNDLLSEPISVYVAAPTKFITRPEEVFWEYNKSVTMTAELHANNEPEINNVKFRWFKDTVVYTFIPPKKFIPDTIMVELIESKKYKGTNSQDLEITKLVWSDRGKYYCVAEGLCGSDTVSCVIGDESRFEIIKVSNDFVGCEGQDITLKTKVITSVEGTFTYQWYKAGFKKLIESDKYLGTQTLELTIKNADYNEDYNNFYVLVTWHEKKVAKRSPSFVVELKTLPIITQQPSNTIIKDRTNKFFGQTYIDVITKNDIGCLYTWYRNGVQARKTCHQSNYWIGIDSCPPYGALSPPPPRPAVPEDVGWYKCKIENECGVTWSDSVYIAWDYYEYYSCIGTDLTLEVVDMGNEYEYIWEFKDNIVLEAERFKNVNTNKLLIKNLHSEDHGYYYVWSLNKVTKTKTLLSKVFAEVIKSPLIIKNFPKEINNYGEDFIRQDFASVISNGPYLYYEIYLNGEKILEDTKYRNEYYANDYGFVVGGRNSNLKPGIYQYFFRNDCGEIWSNKMNVINSAYKPGGIVPNDDIISSYNDNKEFHNLFVFPNPASDFITISDLSNGLQPIVHKVQIFDVLGVLVAQTPTPVITGNSGGNSTQTGASELLRIDISHLPAGVYFVKVGDKVEKFVKL
jgi:hypothetical protein